MTPLVSALASVPGASGAPTTGRAAAASRAESVLDLTLAGRPPAGVHTGSLGRDVATGRVVFTATRLKLIVPPDAAGHLPVPVSAVLRIASSRGDGPATARLTTIRTPADPPPVAAGAPPAAWPRTPGPAPVNAAPSPEHAHTAGPVLGARGGAPRAPASAASRPDVFPSTPASVAPRAAPSSPGSGTATATPAPAAPAATGPASAPTSAPVATSATPSAAASRGGSAGHDERAAPPGERAPTRAASPPAAPAGDRAVGAPALPSASSPPPTVAPPPRDAATAFARLVLGAPFAHRHPSDPARRVPGGGDDRAAAGGDAPRPRLRRGEPAGAGPASAVRGIPFTPPPLERAAAPPLAANVAERVAELAGLGGDGGRPVSGAKLQAFADGLPVALPAAARHLAARQASLVVAIGAGEGDDPAAPPRRLVLEVELPHLGRVRLDGLADGARFDVLAAPVPEAARPGLRALWAMVRARTGLGGELDFPDARKTRS